MRALDDVAHVDLEHLRAGHADADHARPGRRRLVRESPRDRDPLENVRLLVERIGAGSLDLAEHEEVVLVSRADKDGVAGLDAHVFGIVPRLKLVEAKTRDGRVPTVFPLPPPSLASIPQPLPP